MYDGTQFYHFSKAQGFAAERIWAVAEDYLGNIWVGTKKGVYLLEIPSTAATQLENLATTHLQSFHKTDGLKGEDIRLAGLCVTKDRHLYASTGKGLTSLDLQQFYATREQQLPQLHWNSLRLNDQHVDFNYLNNNDFNVTDIDFIQANPFNTYPTALSVPYDVNHFTFSFIGFDWKAPHYIQYQYQLEGLEKKWSVPSDDNQADYRNIPPGNYTFKVRAAGKADTWSEPLSYDFTVLPPWWLTMWAYLLYGVIIGTVLYGFFHFFKNRWLLKNKLERKAAEAQRLLELDSFKNRLITSLTHEFRTPLTVILGMTEQIKTQPNEFLQTGTRLIETNGKNLLRLINQLLDLSKLENHSFTLQWQRDDIITYLRYLCESLQSYAQVKSVHLQFSSTVETLVMDYDAEQTKQVLNNLIANAIKFTPSDGSILVQVSATAEELLIQVEDTGVGISAEHLPHIFDRFYQVETPHKTNVSGTGIGLAHARELVQLMGGTIEASSQLGTGTTFWVRLPIQQRETLSEAVTLFPLTTPSAHPPTLTGEQLTVKKNSDAPQILLVEDNPDVLFYLRSCLADQYQLDFAENGAIGVEKALTNIPDLIISDVMMPEKNGYELCDFLKKDERTSHIPIILLTAKADTESKMEGLRKGADVYLPKPFAKAELLLRIEKMLQRQRKLQAYFSRADILSPTPTPQAEADLLRTEHEFIKKVKTVIADRYADDGFALPQLCEALYLSRTQLYRKMKALIDQSPSQFLRTYRLQRGKELLETNELTVAEVAYRVGFKERSHFSKAFKNEFGDYPTEINK